MQHIYNIPVGYSFLRILAKSIIQRQLPCLQNTPNDNLANILILLPTQRACRDLREILFDENDAKAIIMPEIRAFGALDDEWASQTDDDFQTTQLLDVAQAITPLDRHLILAKYVSKLSALGGVDGRLNLENPAMALHMAKDLAKLFDTVLIEEANPNKLEELINGDFSENWQQITKFLDIVFKTWPQILAEDNKLDIVVRRQILMDLELKHLKLQQSLGTIGPIIAAGSTASVMATKKFLKGILTLDNACVILPGLDQFMDQTSWENIGLAHPQNNIKNFLTFAGISRDAVKPMPILPKVEHNAIKLRRQIASEMVRPTATSHMWHKLPSGFKKQELIDALDGNVSLVEAANLQQEAQIIALMMRKAAQDNQKMALITPDRQLARRVQNELKRWDIHVDDSSGVPLSDTQPSIFLMHICDIIANNFKPLNLLSLLKHPYFNTQFLLNFTTQQHQRAIIALELILLRGVRPQAGIDGLIAALSVKYNQIFKSKTNRYIHPMIKQLSDDDWQLVKQLLLKLKTIFEAINPLDKGNFVDIFTRHIKISETLSMIDDAGNSMIWQSNEGDALAKLASDILQSKHYFDTVNFNDYNALLANLIAGNMVRSKEASFGGLAILGAMEARLADLDVAILGGLNEGIWPQIPQADAWLSRKMMHEIGLPAPERRVGLSSHDFIAAFNVKKIYLTRAEKLGGSPTIASRWLLRLKAVLSAVKASDILAPKLPWIYWAEQIDMPTQITPTKKPEPKPPVSARPHIMSVTDIETWIRDPYAIYAKKILALTPLDDIEMTIDAAEKGSLFHDILHQFSQNYKGEINPDAKEILINIAKTAFSDVKCAWPQLYAFWWPRFLRIADWFLAEEKIRRQSNPTIFSEINGQLYIDAHYGADLNQAFTLKARADRIDINAQNAEIIDYKTGAPPTLKQLEAGFAPQLLLEAAILAQEGFKTSNPQCYIDPKLPLKFCYIQLTGAYPAGKIHDFKKLDYAQKINDALAGLNKRIEDFAKQQTSYKPRELAEFAARFREYDHLSRMKEWSLIEGDET